MPPVTMQRHLVLILSLFALTICVPVPHEESVLRTVIGNFVNCMNSDLNLCLKEHALKATERIGTVRKLDIFNGLTFYNHNPKEAKSLEPLSTDVEERKKQLTERLWESTTDLIQNGELEFAYGEKEEPTALAEEEGRGKKKKIKKKLKFLLPLATLLHAKALALMVISIGIIAFALANLAVIAKIWFISQIVEKFKAYNSAAETPAISWSVEHGDHAHSSLGTGWENSVGAPYSRSLKDANDLAYSGQKKND